MASIRAQKRAEAFFDAWKSRNPSIPDADIVAFLASTFDSLRAEELHKVTAWLRDQPKCEYGELFAEDIEANKHDEDFA
jgi:hypothetical protein